MRDAYSRSTFILNVSSARREKPLRSGSNTVSTRHEFHLKFIRFALPLIRPRRTNTSGSIYIFIYILAGFINFVRRCQYFCVMCRANAATYFIRFFRCLCGVRSTPSSSECENLSSVFIFIERNSHQCLRTPSTHWYRTSSSTVKE